MNIDTDPVSFSHNPNVFLHKNMESVTAIY